MKEINIDQKEFWNHKKGKLWVSLGPRIDDMFGPLGDEALKVLAPQKGENVIDIGCGTATTSLKLAGLLGRKGSVIGMDISKPILEYAKQNAKENSIKNIEFVLADAQNYCFMADSYDAIFSRFGVMFFDDPVAAFSNILKGIKSGGRLTFVCWADRSANDWIEVSTNIASKFLELPPKSAPRDPGPFAFEDPLYLNEVLSDSGWSEISIENYSVTNVVGKSTKAAADFLSRMGPMSVPFEDSEDSVKRKVIDSLEKCFADYVTTRGVEMHFSAWIVTAYKP